MYTHYHSMYWAHSLTLKSASNSISNLGRSISSAKVDINPHQIDAALFAFRSPFSKGTILADEVGLGKTIEAGIVIAQKWAEGKRRVLLILPATLRSQWQIELADKFGLPSFILDTPVIKKERKLGRKNPFDRDAAIITCSYQLAAKYASEIKDVPWDLVVVDEAHRLRNVYKKGRNKNKLARAIKVATAHAPKLLLTATPFPNSLMELFGLVSVVDPQVFGSDESFRDRYLRPRDASARSLSLRERLTPLCQRTLRRQVLEYISFTNRMPLTQAFKPSKKEGKLYDLVTTYLQRPKLCALPAAQRKLMTLVLRKLLASSTFAIAGALNGLVKDLEAMLESQLSVQRMTDLAADYESLRSTKEEWGKEKHRVFKPDANTIRDELLELRKCVDLAESIEQNAKGDALLVALTTALGKVEKMGARKKAVIFTESRRTQDYLYQLLEKNGFSGETCILNGSNNDEKSKLILRRWQDRNDQSKEMSDIKSVNMKAAIVDEFERNRTVLISTQAGAEGINLQFCSLVVNFDLPWNPQRVEQRIGRCHRYGQQFDVVVVNFLNQGNAADQRVYELLADKFSLFEGVFGASDSVLGALETGVDIERRIADVYQSCRTVDEIKSAFDELRNSLSEQVKARLASTEQAVLENLDEDVRKRLKAAGNGTRAELTFREKKLAQLAMQELGPYADFSSDGASFVYSGHDAPKGTYRLHWERSSDDEGRFLHPNHPLAVKLLDLAIGRKLPIACVEFKYGAYEGRISTFESHIGCAGWMELSLLRVESVDTEEFLVFAAMSDSGASIDAETCEKLINLPARVVGPAADPPNLTTVRRAEIAANLADLQLRNTNYFREEEEKIGRWTADLLETTEKSLNDIRARIEATRRESRRASSRAEFVKKAQERLAQLERRQRDSRNKIFDKRCEINARKDELIKQAKDRLAQHASDEILFTIRWRLVQ